MRSLANIDRVLMKAGAAHIIKEIAEGEVVGVTFGIAIDGKEVPFRLPARVPEVLKILELNLSLRAKAETRRKLPEQAQRTAWKNVSDWIEVQLALIETGQVELKEVMMPYLDLGKRGTLFEYVQEKGLPALDLRGWDE